MKVLIVLVFMFSTVVHADELHWTEVSEVLTHNQRLIEYTTIGKNLKESDNPRVIKLYNSAKLSLLVAKDSLKEGDIESARKFSLKSIRTIYIADEILNSLPMVD